MAVRNEVRTDHRQVEQPDKRGREERDPVSLEPPPNELALRSDTKVLFIQRYIDAGAGETSNGCQLLLGLETNARVRPNKENVG